MQETPQKTVEEHVRDSHAGAYPQPPHVGAPSSDRPFTPPPKLDVHPARWRELGALRALNHIEVFDRPDVFLQNYNRWSHALREAQWRANLPGRFLLAKVDETPVGFADFRIEKPDGRWALVALGFGEHQGQTPVIAERLVEQGIIQAGRKGAKRIYGRIPVDSPALPPLIRLGFQRYATETVFVAIDPPGSLLPRDVRAQEQADTWAIHQLYSATTPAEVQHAEAFTSHRWDLNLRATKAGRNKGWIIEDGHTVIGHTRISTQSATHVIEIFNDPDLPSTLQPLLDCALSEIRPGRGERVYCAVRSYQQSLATALHQRGFEPLLEQHLMIKYTAVPIRQAASESVLLKVDVRERLPQRVPTLLRRQTGDEVAH